MEKLSKITYGNRLTPVENRDAINELIDENERLRVAVIFLSNIIESTGVKGMENHVKQILTPIHSKE